MSSAFPTHPRGFKVIIEGIPDFEPMSSIQIPTRWICQLLIDLELGKIQVRGGIKPYSRYSFGSPRKYFMSVVVTFESTINEEMRTALEIGKDIQITYASDEEEQTIKNDKYLTIKHYKPYEEESTRRISLDSKKIHQSAIFEKNRTNKSKLSRMVANNSFASLICE